MTPEPNHFTHPAHDDAPGDEETLAEVLGLEDEQPEPRGGDDGSEEALTSIASLVHRDYDGSEQMDTSEARSILSLWRESSPRAREMIDSRGMQRAVSEYVAGWDEIHREEYGL